MRISTDKWRNAALAKTPSKPTYKLMGVEWGDESYGENYCPVFSEESWHYSNEWFIVPTGLMGRYRHARKLLTEVEVELSEWHKNTNHRRNTYPFRFQR